MQGIEFTNTSVGTGKTTLVITACRNFGSGVLYFALTAHEIEDFPYYFALASGYDFSPNPTFLQILADQMGIRKVIMPVHQFLYLIISIFWHEKTQSYCITYKKQLSTVLTMT